MRQVVQVTHQITSQGTYCDKCPCLWHYLVGKRGDGVCLVFFEVVEQTEFGWRRCQECLTYRPEIVLHEGD